MMGNKKNHLFAPLSQWNDPEVNLEKLPFWGALGSQGGARQYGSIKARKTSKTTGFLEYDDPWFDKNDMICQ